MDNGIIFLSQITAWPKISDNYLKDKFMKPCRIKAEGLYQKGKYFEAIGILDPIFKTAETKGVQYNLPVSILKLYFPMPEKYLTYMIEHLPQKIKDLPAEEQLSFILLCFAIIKAESQFNPKALSYKNAEGLMQILPSTSDIVNKDLKEVACNDLFNPEVNLRVGMHYLASLISGFDAKFSYITASLASWHFSPERAKDIMLEYAVFTDGMENYSNTNNFVTKVKYYFEFYKILYEKDVKDRLNPTLTDLLITEIFSVLNYFIEKPDKKEEVGPERKLYLVIAKRTRDAALAKKIEKRLKDSGVDCFVRSNKNEFLVQAGAFRNKTNADDRISMLKNLGFKPIIL
ncbi:MAG: transglycosylase SLT domain-containing protein [Candidatus Saganbacteria bacterium]|nr:transglycosylase SLT domain-containing protein [Candidatus Saganbacteria bacterium]